MSASLKEQPAIPVPENLPEELVPVFEWYHTKGKDQILIGAVALAIACGVYAFMHHIDVRNAEGVAQITSARVIEDLEEASANYSSTKAAPIISLKLAKAYYTEGRYEDAENAFKAFIDNGKAKIFLPEANLGLGASLEASGKFSEAKAAYEAVAGDGPASVAAKLGIARVLAATGDKVTAVQILDDLAVAKKDTIWEVRATNLKGVVERFTTFRAEPEPAAIDEVIDSAVNDAQGEVVSEEVAPAPEEVAEVATEEVAPALEEVAEVATEVVAPATEAETPATTE